MKQRLIITIVAVIIFSVTQLMAQGKVFIDKVKHSRSMMNTGSLSASISL